MLALRGVVHISECVITITITAIKWLPEKKAHRKDLKNDTNVIVSGWLNPRRSEVQSRSQLYS